MKLTLEERAIVILDSLEALEYKNKVGVISLLDSLSELFSLSGEKRDALTKLLGEARVKTLLLAFGGDYEETVTDGLEETGTIPLTYLSENYPEDLKGLPAYPLVLYANGNVDLLKEKRFAIVGSRKCLPFATALVKDYAATVSSLGGVVVTGSAGGADKSAIEGASESGNIISVLAGGIRHVYPEYNKRLIEDLAKNGLVLSEQNPSVSPKPWMFPVRNRIIAGLAKGVLIAGGERDSGARHTADFAAEYGREVFAFPYSIGIATGELNNNLIKNGAALCDSVDDILDFLGLEKREEETLELEEEEKLVFEYVKSGVCDVASLAEKTGMKMYELAPALSSLEISGYIVKMAGNVYRAVK